jgi:selenocysteine-specific elongation factor
VAEVVGVARVAVNLRGVSADAVGRGDVLVSPRRWLTTATIDARLSAARGDEPVDSLPASLIMHIGAAAVPVRIRPLPEGPTGVGQTSRSASVSVRLTLSSPLPLRIGDRALLRDPGRHRIAAGLTVLDVHPPNLKRRGAAARRATELASMSGAPDPAGELARRGLIERARLAAMGADPTALPDTAAVNSGAWLLDHDLAVRLAQRLVSVVTEHEHNHPLERGLSLGSARRALGLPNDQLVEAVLAQAGAHGSLAVTGGRIHRTGHDQRELLRALCEAVATLTAELSDNPFAAPDTDRLAGLGLDSKALAALVRAGELEKISPDVYLRPGAEQAALDVLRGLPEREFTVSSARQAWNTSRRVAVPLLELLARHGHTARTTDGRHRLLRWPSTAADPPPRPRSRGTF